MELNRLQPGVSIHGFLPGHVFHVKSVEAMGADMVSVIGVDDDGNLHNRLVSRTDAAAFVLVEGGRRWGFDADPNLFKLAAEALRIRLAWVFDPLIAVNSSNIEPLPHQISAVYDHMIKRQPLRYLLADDPGAGKTIMAGLLVKELILRADVERCLIVVPGNLAEQWQDELREKFALFFQIMTNDKLEAAASGNWLSEENLVIARLDKLSRDERLHPKLRAVEWDLVIFDEAHKLSASFTGGEIKRTKRHQIAQLISTTTRHFLLMTATPHNGKEEDFQLFLSLLDGDRFEGKFRDGVHKIDPGDLMRRLIKEQLVRFDGSPLFPPRRAYTVNYQLSAREAHLYAAVTTYVREEFNRADKLEEGRKTNIGFALTILQRRLASSPAAIQSSLIRRKKRLEEKLRELKLGKRGQTVQPAFTRAYLSVEELEDLDDAPDAEVEDAEELLLLNASTAETIDELEKEIETLRTLEALAGEVIRSGEDKKWTELSRLIQEDEHMTDSSGNRRKLVIFTEHKDTLNYLAGNIRTLIGNDDAVVTISGGMGREDRRKQEARFKQDRDVHFLVATDAAGEGINLQRAHLMINYDLPWNPNRLEQRFGRIHRIGQTEVCHLWNLVASETREGSVFERLLSKLEVESIALGGRVFDILGEVFDGKTLRDLLIQAIRLSDEGALKQSVFSRVDELFDTDRLRELMNAHALAADTMDSSNVQKIRDLMDRAQMRKLQPHFISSFFLEAFHVLGGSIRPRETGRYEIRNVPVNIRDRDRQIGVHAPVLKRYERVTFDRRLVDLDGRPADLVTPGHPLLGSVIDLILERYRGLLRNGTVLVDHSGRSDRLRVMVLLDHELIAGRTGRDGRPIVAGKRLQFVEIDAEGDSVSSGYAPYLDYRPASDAERSRVLHERDLDWITDTLEKKAVQYAAAMIAPDHLEEVRRQRVQIAEKTAVAVESRLKKEIMYWDHRAEDLRLQEVAGKRNARLNYDQARAKVEELQHRLTKRLAELEQEKSIHSAIPVVRGAALIVPASMLQGDEPQSVDTASRKRVEALAMNAVAEAERSLGNEPEDVSALNRGWDIESRDGVTGELRFLEVKGRASGSTTITITKNEMYGGYNHPERFVLALVFVSVDDAGSDVVDGPYYIREPFDHEPGWAEDSTNLNVSKLLQRAEKIELP